MSQWQGLIVLKENRDAYEPLQQQILEYGEYLGLIFPGDEKFIPLLKQALKAPLPLGWEACETPTDDHQLVYRHIETKKVQFQHPLDSIYRQKIGKLKKQAQYQPSETIMEERESWLKDSSDMIINSLENSKNPEPRKYTIDDISEQESVFDGEKQEIFKIEFSQEHREIRPLQIHSKRREIKQEIPFDMNIIRARISDYIPSNIITMEEITMGPPVMKSQQEAKKLGVLLERLEEIRKKQIVLAEIQREKKRKFQSLKQLEKEII